MRKLILAALVVCVVSPAWGVDSNGYYNVLGFGVKSCGSYTKASGNRKEEYIVWATGFLTAVNFTIKGKSDWLKGTDMDGVRGWLDNHCRSNPTNNFATSVVKLSRYLIGS
jgi:hypothetical protein